jgi:hypothetical protein
LLFCSFSLARPIMDHLPVECHIFLFLKMHSMMILKFLINQTLLFMFAFDFKWLCNQIALIIKDNGLLLLCNHSKFKWSIQFSDVPMPKHKKYIR